jgi:uncharacterized membrane protein YadS
MISRLTAVAALFSVLATASLAYAATAQHQAATSAPVVAKQVRIVQLQPVVITAKRI